MSDQLIQLEESMNGFEEFVTTALTDQMAINYVYNKTDGFLIGSNNEVASIMTNLDPSHDYVISISKYVKVNNGWGTESELLNLDIVYNRYDERIVQLEINSRTISRHLLSTKFFSDDADISVTLFAFIERTIKSHIENSATELNKWFGEK